MHVWAKSADPDQTAPLEEQSDQGLHYLLVYLHLLEALLNEPRHEKTVFFFICENKDADQLRGNCEADQRLCFRYMDSTTPLLPIS